MRTTRSTELTLGALLTRLQRAGHDRLHDETTGGAHWAAFLDWCHARGVGSTSENLAEWCALTEAELTGDDYAALLCLAQGARS